jgi:hypothetical protein
MLGNRPHRELLSPEGQRRRDRRSEEAVRAEEADYLRDVVFAEMRFQHAMVYTTPLTCRRLFAGVRPHMVVGGDDMTLRPEATVALRRYLECPGTTIEKMDAEYMRAWRDGRRRGHTGPGFIPSDWTSCVIPDGIAETKLAAMEDIRASIANDARAHSAAQPHGAMGCPEEAVRVYMLEMASAACSNVPLAADEKIMYNGQVDFTDGPFKVIHL